MLKIPTEHEFKIASQFIMGTKSNSEDVYPSNEEVLACEKVFKFFIDIGNSFGQDMLTAWGISNFIHYERLSYSRKLKIK